MTATALPTVRSTPGRRAGASRSWRVVRPGPAGSLVAGFLVLYAFVGLWLVLGEHSIVGDALSRVANATYVVDSRQPKLANLGFVWTPLPSLLVLPFLPARHLWPALVEQGLLGNAMSALAMAASVGVLHGLLRDLRVGRRVSLVLAVAYGLQPMVVWYGANGMTEALLLLFLLLAARDLVRHRADGDARRLMAAGGWLALGYLSRYEVLAAGCAATVLVAATAWRTTAGGRSQRRAAALADALLVGSPVAAAFVLWAAASWAVVGHPFEQFTSDYGNSALVSSGGAVGAGHTGLLVAQALVLAPLLPVAVLGAALRARRLRDVSVLAPAALTGAVLAFEAITFAAGSLFGFLRYQIAVVPLFFVLVGYALAGERRPSAVPADPVGAPTRRPGGAAPRRWRPALVAVVAVGAGIPGVVTSGTAFLTSPDLASQEWSHVRPALLALAGDGPPVDGSSSNGAFDIDRGIAARLDGEDLPDGSVVVDSGSGFAVLAASRDPRQFVITSDGDFAGAVADPIGHRVRYLLVNRDPSQYDAVAAAWPDLVDGSTDLPWLELDTVFPALDAPGAHAWSLWRVTAGS